GRSRARPTRRGARSRCRTAPWRSPPGACRTSRTCRSGSRRSLLRGRLDLQAREAELLALRVVGLRHRLRQPAHAKDVTLAFGDADRAPRVEQVEAVAGLGDLVVDRKSVV